MSSIGNTALARRNNPLDTVKVSMLRSSKATERVRFSISFVSTSKEVIEDGNYRTGKKQETTIVTSTPDRVVKTTREVVTPTGGTSGGGYGKKKAIFRAYQVIWYILGVIEVLLAFRFLFRLLGANPLSGFVAFIYALSAPLVAPFRGIFRTSAIEGAVLEWSTLVAMVVYAVIAYGIVHLLKLGKPVRPDEVETTVENV